jgi:hypothetical protein
MIEDLNYSFYFKIITLIDVFATEGYPSSYKIFNMAKNRIKGLNRETISSSDKEILLFANKIRYFSDIVPFNITIGKPNSFIRVMKSDLREQWSILHDDL